MKRALPLDVLLRLAFDGREVREQISMREAYAFRLGSRARREDDFSDAAFADGFVCIWRWRMMRDRCGKFFKAQRWNIHAAVAARKQEFSSDLMLNAVDKI